MNTRERIFYYDFLRTFAILAVIICHLGIFYGLNPTPTQTIMKITMYEIGGIGVPIFLMISGALLLKKKYDLSDFLKRRFSRIIYPYLFWVALIVIGIFIVQHDYKLMFDIITGEFSVTWYFWTIIGIYLSIPVVKAFVNEHGETALKYFLVIWFFTIILKTLNSYPLFTNLNLDFFAGYIGYPILGYYLDNKKFRLDTEKIFIISIIIFIACFITSSYIVYAHLNISYPMYQNVLTVLIASSFFMLIKSIDNITSFNEIKNNIIGKIIISISICSYGMYFSHVLVLKALSFVNPHSDLLVPVMGIAMVILSWLAVLIVSKIPYLKRFSGV